MTIRRVTIVLRPEHETKLRKIQAELIRKTNKGKSFSEIINCIIAEGLKHPRSCDE